VVERLQAPVLDVPVPANAPAASTAVPVLVVPAPGAGTAGPGTPSASGGGTGSAAGPSGAGQGAGAGTGPGTGPGGIAAQRGAEPRPLILPNVSNLPGPYRIQPQRSLADMANEQLRRGRPRDPLAQGMEGAALQDCVRAPTNTPTVGGLLAGPVLAARALSGRCPQ